MIKHYVKIALRSLARQKGLAFINVFGLSVGISCFVLFLLYSVNELSFDGFHKNADNIYRVYEWTTAVDGTSSGSVSMSMPLGSALKKDLPGVVNYVRIKQANDESFMRVGDNDVRRVKVSYADPQFFTMFTFPLKYGNAAAALPALNSLVVTESKAKELFGTDNVVGQTVQVQVDNSFQPFVITGVAKDVPANSTIGFDVMGNFAFMQTTNYGIQFNNWYTTSFRTYVQLIPGSSLPHDAKQLAKFHQTYYPPEEAQSKTAQPLVTFGLQPLRALHTDTRLNDNSSVAAIEPKTIWIILAIAGGILLIACINFTTLAIGRSAGRSKEVGVRKVIGAEKKQLVIQFLAEALILSIISTATGLLLANLALPYFNSLSGRDLQFSFTQYPQLTWLLTGLVVLVGIVSGSYPAIVLAGFKPLEVLKNKLRIGGSNFFTRALVTFQFALSGALIMATVILLQQTTYMAGKNPGFNKENVVVVDAAHTDVKKIYPLYKQALLAHTTIAGVGSAGAGLGEGSEFNDHGFKYNNAQRRVYESSVDEDYVPVLGMQLLRGRNFSQLRADDTTLTVLVNEAMVNQMGWTLDNAVGQRIKGYTNTLTPEVIGVLKNFNFQPLREEVKPLMFYHFAGAQARQIFVRLKPGNPATTLAYMQKEWNKVSPDAPFKYSFVDENLDNFYKAEQRWSSIVGWAGGISIFLACLGLFGLTALAAVNRVKEIGIRKVLGAPVLNIAQLLAKDFIKLVAIALLVAGPVAWYFMHNWLQSYPDRINISWWVFALTGMAALMIAVATIGFHAIKAAVANPVKSLRSE